MIGQTVADVWRMRVSGAVVEMSRYGYSLAREMRTQVECEAGHSGHPHPPQVRGGMTNRTMLFYLDILGLKMTNRDTGQFIGEMFDVLK